MVVKVLSLRTAGTNCDAEGNAAFEKVGAKVDHRHVREIYQNPSEIHRYRVIFFPGGFSYGDYVAAGKIQAVETRLFLQKEISQFVKQGGYVLGVCNGFQVLVKTGLLPGLQPDRQEFSITYNDSGKFEDRWVRLRTEKSRCEFLPEGWEFDVPTAHGEGKLVPKTAELIDRVFEERLALFRYVDAHGNPTMDYPANPNGSMQALAGLCDPTGRILGLMPHPERNSLPHHHPQWTHPKTKGEGDGLRLFELLVRAAR